MDFVAGIHVDQGERIEAQIGDGVLVVKWHRKNERRFQSEDVDEFVTRLPTIRQDFPDGISFCGIFRADHSSHFNSLDANSLNASSGPQYLRPSVAIACRTSRTNKAMLCCSG